MKDVVGYEGLYAVTSCGKVWSYKRQKFLKPKANSKGYLYVDLCKNGEVKRYYIHRLIGEAFLPNPDNLPEIDHIDNNKNHNYLNNLQWISHKDNVRKSCNKPVLQFTLDGEFVREWDCANDVRKEINKQINNCLKGRTKTAYGFKWFYKN